MDINYNLTLILMITSVIIIIFYNIYFFFRISRFRNKYTSNFNDPISVIICAKNEGNNLSIHLPKILNQNYNDYEVIVVNDQSNDDTKIVLENFQKKYKRLKIVNIDLNVKHRVGKKFALTLGIKSSKYNYVLLTDADCFPTSKNWINDMVGSFNKHDIVLGFGNYEKTNSFLNKLIRFDTYIIAKQYFAYCLAKIPYMGVGRNLGYKKSLFFENKGFANNIHIPSGDDDLFIQDIANSNNCSINTSSHTVSKVINKWNEWIYQKRRHISTSKYYQNKFKILLFLYPFSKILLLISTSFHLIFNINMLSTYITLLIYLLLTYVVNYKPMKKLNSFDLYFIHPILDFINIFVQSIFTLYNTINQPKNWK